MEREKGKVNYAVVDAILHWTTENEIPLRAHNVYWGIPGYVQSWLKEMDDQDLEQTLKNRAETLAARYKGRFAEYDLNNEMIHGNYYEDRLGPDITKKMAEWMHSQDPAANLYLNDYDIATGNKLPEYMAHIRTLRQQGVPIAGIGVQGHLHADTFDRTELKRALDSLAQFNLPICITEFNIPGQRSKYMNDRTLKMTAEEEELNATELVDYYRICFAHPAVKGIIQWGFWEKANWIPVSSMYRADWSATPSAEAYRNLIFKEWWTNVSGKTDRKGNFSTSAFYGKYKITAGNVTKIVDFTKSSGDLVIDFTADITPYPGGSGKFTHLVWQDEFDGSGLPDASKWSYEKGYIRNREMQYYTEGRIENAVQRNGNLVITARNDSILIDGEIHPVTSASIRSKDKGDWLYGRIEVRAKLPSCLGTWPAIWMMPTKGTYGGWPKSGEIDIMEHVGFNPDRIFFNLHTGKYNHSIGTGRGTSVVCPDPHKDFHVYAVEWFEDHIDWFLDDKHVFSVKNDGTGWESWPLVHPFYLILNFAFGGAWGGQQGVDLTQLPQSYFIDYVRVFQ
jgi:GH35 family endo-1,4-beta-xylanase/beta-glucanase (GH16 family)